MRLVFQNKTNTKIIGFQVTHFGFVLALSDIDLWNKDLLGTHLDLLDADIPSKHFVCLQDVLKTSSRYAFKMSSRHVFKTSWRRLQRNNLLSSKTSLPDVFKRSLRRLGRRKIVTLKICWRRLQDMSWRPTYDCWVCIRNWWYSPKIVMIYFKLRTLVKANSTTYISLSFYESIVTYSVLSE